MIVRRLLGLVVFRSEIRSGYAAWEYSFTPLPHATRLPHSAYRARRARTRRRSTLLWVAEHCVAIALGVMFLGPFVFVVLTSVMTDQQANTPDLWPSQRQWSNFATVLHTAPMVRWFANTLLYAGTSTILVVVSSVPVAYALARFRFRGRNAAFLAVLTMMMLPPQVLVIPLYIVWANVHLTGPCGR
jgi:multiple sugar transport system permease protein